MDLVNETLQLVSEDDIVIAGKIDDHSLVVLVSTGGSITIEGKIDGHSSVSLRAKGDVKIGTVGGEGDKKIDGGSGVEVVAGGDIVLGSQISQSTVDLRAHGKITMDGKIDQSKVRQIADGDIVIRGKLDGQSRIDLVSNRGSVMVEGKIDGESKVSLTAAEDVGVGVDPDVNVGADDRKIDGNSTVTITAGQSIEVRGGIFKEHTSVDLIAGADIEIAKIAGGASVRLMATAGPTITVPGGIHDDETSVLWWPPEALIPAVFGDPEFAATEWTHHDTFTTPSPSEGYWWQNWPQTFGYVAQQRRLPRTVEDLAKLVHDHKNLSPVKAVGGGWSFTDAALPFLTQQQVDHASIQLRGASQRQDMRQVQEGIDDLHALPMDLQPQAVELNRSFSTQYDQALQRQITRSGAQLPATAPALLIDTRAMASSLQCGLADIRAASNSPEELLFHVEAGVTMADLQQLLDHQHPRLALESSGGSSGATLAGALSTATHGGEFKSELLADSVRAIHLVGPGGVQWWIEGSKPVADQVKLQQRYPAIDAAHFIGGAWNAIPGLTAEDVLKAVVVSMGTMGVIYSVVLRVVPQYGIRQVIHPTSWTGLLARAGVTEQDLRDGTVGANTAVLGTLLDGTINGTGIPLASNIYADLAMNPINRDCWVVNRRVTPTLPDDDNKPAVSIGGYSTALSRSLTGAAETRFQDSEFAGRVFDFLSWATDDLDALGSNTGQAARLLGFVGRQSDPLAAVLALANNQTVANTINQSGAPDRGIAFLGDALTGFFHALEGTGPGLNSDCTAVSYKVGATNWPSTGMPGRGLEIAMDARNAFTFLQSVLFDQILTPLVTVAKQPLIGYLSIRVCSATNTLLGMQQFRNSVMIEVVSYRSPQANAIMDLIQKKALEFVAPAAMKPLLHWGLENNQLTPAHLAASPLGQAYKPGFTRLSAFTAVRQFLLGGHPPVFNNNFTQRTGL